MYICEENLAIGGKLMPPSDDGGPHDQANAAWIVIRTQLRGHNDTPFGQPAPWLALRPPGVWPPFGRILYVLVTIN
jgi:hypothetical protein